jgi:hypothetical protein
MSKIDEMGEATPEIYEEVVEKLKRAGFDESTDLLVLSAVAYEALCLCYDGGMHPFALRLLLESVIARHEKAAES